ncbi:sec-independent protein translocase protein TatA [Quadrisphaera granulorum]|uniref:Sec-independent protein translocase protein TatA n=1 Tax=Quadrisphaera granulorum TaxID=317664 RepID=A0A316A6X8_9ACTN|nr:Sec-independent protein translocase subunit TatA [Quadrisphaera granulorum]PWJ53189.1 sec-independent protein translocase protein TatA [Quadrisphaera granulorum]SZE97121.1 sec-independent protein translocase protein TatA [Quadrisphaera granulorum]
MGRVFENPVLLLVVVLLVVLLFGAKRLPDAARSVGRSMRIFKSEVKGMKEDDRADEERRASSSADGAPSRPLEGRVVDEPHRATSDDYDQHRRSA